MAKFIQPTFDVYGVADFKNQVTIDASLKLNGAGDNNLVVSQAFTASSADTPYALVLESTTGSVRVRALGTMAWATESNYYTTTESDDNFVDIDGDTMTGILVFDNLGFTLDGVTIATIETEAEGLSASDTAMGTSNAIRSYVDAQSGAANRGASNGLIILTDGSYGLGGTLTEDTSITLGTSEFSIQDGAEKIFSYDPNVSYPILELKARFETGSAAATSSIKIGGNDLQEYIYIGNSTDYLQFTDGKMTVYGDPISYNTGVLATLDSHVPTLAQVNSIAGGTSRGASNGLKILTDGSYGLGSALTEPTTITTTGTNTLTLAGLTSGTTRLAVISDSGVLKTQQLGTMALAATTSYYTQTNLSTSGQSSVHWDNITNWSATTAEFNTALSDGNFAIAGGAFHDGFSDYVGDEHIDHSTIYIDAGYGMNAISGGTIDASVTITLGTPTTLTSSTTNTVSETSHAHAITGFTTDGELTSALADYVPAAGGTFTGGVAFGSVGTPIDVSIYSSLYVHGDTTIGGTLTIDGSLLVRDVEAIDISSGFIFLNTGQTGTPPASMQAGIVIDRGDELPYVFLYDESNETFRIGTAPQTAGPSFDDASTQSVATRQDAPTDTAIAFWNADETRFDTNTGLLWDSGLKLNNDIDFILNTGNRTIQGAEQVGATGYSLTLKGGTGGANSAGGNAYITGGDGTGTGVGGYTYIRGGTGSTTGRVYIGDSNTNQVVIGSGTNLYLPSLSAQNSEYTTLMINGSNVVGTRELGTMAFETAANFNVKDVASTTGVSGHEVYSNTTSDTAYSKRIVAGTGATITSDSSTIEISVTGSAGYVSKYTGSFNASGIETITITQATHELSQGYYNISVYEAGILVYVETAINGSGDVTFTWTTGALAGTIEYIIAG